MSYNIIARLSLFLVLFGFLFYFITIVLLISLPFLT